VRDKIPTSIFGKRLREARLLAGIPQDRLGVAIGLDETAASARISRYETGTHEPPFDIATKLAKVLNVATPFFYCEDDELAAVLLAWKRAPKSAKREIHSLVSSAD
jgi:transcriptional regulator with XRE-family HTH domain